MKWEGSKADRAADKKGAEKAKMPEKKWEGSRKDKAADAVAKRMAEGKKK